jgi:hypothetical protein
LLLDNLPINNLIMRLLNSTTLKLREFFGSEIPPYAILSHTWGEDEVSLNELQAGNVRQKKGFQKIERCCKIAAENGYEYAWVDTAVSTKRVVRSFRKQST